MEFPRIFRYKNEKLEKIISLNEGEKGSFGFFEEDWDGYSGNFYDKNNVIIFAPNQKYFENKAYEGHVGTHRFQRYLKDNLKSLREDIAKLDERFRNYRGGKEGEYEFKNNCLAIRSNWQTDSSNADSEAIGKLLKSHPEFKLENYKILEGLHPFAL
jgi:hypothetical protein